MERSRNEKMKKIVFTISILLLIFSCKTELKASKISGSWYSCAHNGDYIEMHIKGNKYKYSMDFAAPINWNEFEIKQDTLFQYNNYIFPDSLIINKATIKFTDNETLKIDYFTSDESWTFKKLNEDIANIENDFKLQLETIQRSKNAKCIDYRTEEEKKRDSIDFEF